MRFDLSTIILTNAAGMVKTEEDAEKLLDSAVTRITIGSITMLERPGNIGETYYYDEDTHTAWNSKGLDNPGFEQTMRWLPRFGDRCRAAGKEIALSIAGFNPDEYGDMAFRASSHVDLIEVNAGCGNIWDGGKQKAIPSYDPPLFRQILREVDDAVGERPMVTVKVSPVVNELIVPLAAAATAFSSVIELIATNTKPNQRSTRPDGRDALAFQEVEGAEVKHVGGMSGADLAPDSKRVLEGLARAVDPMRIRLLACGGIEGGEHLLDRLERGAVGAAIGTAFFQSGARIFSDTYAEALARLEAA